MKTITEIRAYLDGMALTTDEPGVALLGNALKTHLETINLPEDEIPVYMLALLDCITDTAMYMREKLDAKAIHADRLECAEKIRAIAEKIPNQPIHLVQ